MEALNTVQHKAAEAMYGRRARPGAAGQPGGGPTGGGRRRPHPGDVIDAEVVEEEKK